MNKSLLLLVLSTCLVVSCDCTYDYKVFAENSTGSDLKIYCKGYEDSELTQDTITIQNGETQLLISAKDVFPGGGCAHASCEHCTYVIDFIHAYINDSMQSNINICNCDKIIFKEVDKYEGEMTIKYTLNDF